MNKVKIGNIEVGGQNPLVLFAGPCVLEGLERSLKIGRAIKDICDRLGVQYVFKASYDKANRSSYKAYRGPGLEEGLKMLATIKKELGVPVISDVHECDQIAKAAEVLDVMQIPAFLCRQTDLLETVAKSGRVVNVKKGQFMAPDDMKNVVDKLTHAGATDIMLTERGASFGYHNLVVDMRGLAMMREFGYPVVFDATHSVQLPGGAGTGSSGQRQFVSTLTRAAVAVGVDALFMEIHDKPEEALCDGANMLAVDQLEDVLKDVLAIDAVVRRHK